MTLFEFVLALNPVAQVLVVFFAGLIVYIFVREFVA